MYSPEDTIAAIATPPGRAGIGIVRLSGDRAASIIQDLFCPTDPTWLGCRVHGRLYHGHILSRDEEVVDEVLVAYMAAPRTYTREDVVEIQAHGGSVVLSEILELCLSAGARLADPGEFTLRAFLNGRLDLSQAEAVAGVVAARTTAGLRLVTSQLDGRLSHLVSELRAELLGVRAYLEARIDFPDESIEDQSFVQDLVAVEARLQELIRATDRGLLYREGVRVAIVGRPNVGKSSLLNALLRYDRAIVTPIPGTTRDTLEEAVDIHGVPVILVDTAGLTETDDAVERLGIQRTHDALASADLALLVLDASQPLTSEDWAVAGATAKDRTIVVLNKSDLPGVRGHNGLLPSAAHVRVSALMGQGLASLEESILALALGTNGETQHAQQLATEARIGGNARHRVLLARAHTHVADAITAHGRGIPDDLLSLDVADAVQALGEITGETSSAELLETIFARFCIGK